MKKSLNCERTRGGCSLQQTATPGSAAPAARSQRLPPSLRWAFAAVKTCSDLGRGHCSLTAAAAEPEAGVRSNEARFMFGGSHYQVACKPQLPAASKPGACICHC